jgi:hypothetical protein
MSGGLEGMLSRSEKGGILLSGLDNGINFLFDDEERRSYISCRSIP